MSDNFDENEVTPGHFDLSFHLLSMEWWSGVCFSFAVLEIGDRALLSIYRPFHPGYINIDILFFHVK